MKWFRHCLFRRIVRIKFIFIVTPLLVPSNYCSACNYYKCFIFVFKTYSINHIFIILNFWKKFNWATRLYFVSYVDLNKYFSISSK